MNSTQHCLEYLKLLKHPQIRKLLLLDFCGILADKYHLAIVMLYFQRAKFAVDEYNVWNFHVALYLSHDINEELTDFKEYIIFNLLGVKSDDLTLTKFLDERLKLAMRMNYKVFVSENTCKMIFIKVPNKIWNRNRNLAHSGVIKYHENCIICKQYSCNFCKINFIH